MAVFIVQRDLTTSKNHRVLNMTVWKMLNLKKKNIFIEIIKFYFVMHDEISVKIMLEL